LQVPAAVSKALEFFVELTTLTAETTSISALSIRSFPNITKLLLEDCDESYVTNEALFKCRNLRHLTLSPKSVGRYPSLRSIFSLEGLVHLVKLSICKHLFHVDIVKSFGSLRALEQLSLHSCTFVDPSELMKQLGIALAQTPLNVLVLGLSAEDIAENHIKILLNFMTLRLLILSEYWRHRTALLDSNNPKILTFMPDFK
jgi:Leucine-rich repeat (LRR) protein